jgi:adenylate cyclase
MIRRLAALVRSPIALWVTGVTLLVMFLLVYRPTLTEFMELKLYDLKFRYRGSRPPSPEVVILAIDDDSLKKMGRWPWSREDQARLLKALKAAGPRVILLDIIFAEKEEGGAFKAVNNLRRELARKGLASPEILALLEQERRRADADRRLAEVIKEGPPTILGFFFRGVGPTAGGVQAERLMGANFVRASTYNLVRLLDTKPSEVPLIGAAGVQLNLPEIIEASAGGGYFNMQPDDDGTVRWLPMAILYGSDFFAPESLVTMAQYLGRPPLAITLSQLGVEEIRLGRKTIPVNRHGQVLINYLGKEGTIPTYSAAALLDGDLPPQVFKDKIVLLGATAVGIYDLRVTPFSGLCPGVEIQATVLDNLIKGNFIRTPRYGLPLILCIILGLGILLGVSLPRLSAAWAFILTLAIIEAYTIADYLLFSRLNLSLKLFYPLLTIVLVYVCISMQRFLAEERERARIRKAFESYVAPTVVQEMLKHPEALRLGGERREITLLFTDIRGFTTIAETYENDPESLVRMLHDFLNPMSNIIIKHGGTIDKYMGDAIMALFGAPLSQPDHPRLACQAALEMSIALKNLNAHWQALGRPVLRIGVGINSGTVTVGNLGSDRLFDYTAIGDNVNLASRLEGLNKHYGTTILISQSTAELLGNDFILRDVDRVRVKGKAQAANIFEIMGEGEPDPELARFLDSYHQGLALYRQGRWQDCLAPFGAALEVLPEDGPIRRYLTLAEKLLLAHPSSDWEAVTVMDEK